MSSVSTCVGGLNSCSLPLVCKLKKIKSPALGKCMPFWNIHACEVYVEVVYSSASPTARLLIQWHAGFSWEILNIYFCMRVFVYNGSLGQEPAAQHDSVSSPFPVVPDPINDDLTLLQPHCMTGHRTAPCVWVEAKSLLRRPRDSLQLTLFKTKVRLATGENEGGSKKEKLIYY